MICMGGLATLIKDIVKIAYDTFRNYNPFDIKRSAGEGIRIFMPAFGLLGIDFGYGFDPVLNGVGRNGWETHFIIGQQF